MKRLIINSIVCLIVTVLKVQGYYNQVNGTIVNKYILQNDVNGTIFNKYIQQNDVNSINGQNSFNTHYDEDVFRHYRSDSNKREPRFISFTTKDDNIEVEIDFAIPFLSIPVKRSLSGAMGTMQSVLSGIPMANVNVGAVVLAGVVALGGALIGGIARFFNGGISLNTGPFFKSGKKKQKQNDNYMWDALENIDKALLKFDFDTTACTQRAICWYVKNSNTNVYENKATQLDKIISGLSGADWALQMISNTAWDDAVKAGRRGVSCELTYANCKLTQSNIEKFTNNLLKFTKQK